MPRVKIIIFLFLSFFCFSVLGQRTLYIGVHSDGGIPMNSYGQGKDVLRSKLTSYHLAYGGSIGLIFGDRIGIEVGLAQNAEKWRLRDKSFSSRHEGFEVDLRSKNHYLSFFGNIQYLQPLSFKTSLYFQIGYSINNVGGGNLSQTREFVRNNENVTATSTFKSGNESIVPEIGIQKKLGEKGLLTIGMKLNLGQTNILEGEYQVEKNGTIIDQDTYTSKGSYLGPKVKLAYIIDQTYKKERVPKKPRQEDPVVIIPPPDTAKPKPVDPPKEVEGREIQVTNKVEVKSKKVTIKVWDHQKVDGDRVSLYLNNRWILINYSLQKKEKVIEVELNEGDNFMVLHALNLGKYHPNTAAIIIDDGTKENQIILESTLETSGTIQITFNP